MAGCILHKHGFLYLSMTTGLRIIRLGWFWTRSNAGAGAGGLTRRETLDWISVAMRERARLLTLMRIR